MYQYVLSEYVTKIPSHATNKQTPPPFINSPSCHAVALWTWHDNILTFSYVCSGSSCWVLVFVVPPPNNRGTVSRPTSTYITRTTDYTAVIVHVYFNFHFPFSTTLPLLSVRYCSLLLFLPHQWSLGVHVHCRRYVSVTMTPIRDHMLLQLVAYVALLIASKMCETCPLRMKSLANLTGCMFTPLQVSSYTAVLDKRTINKGGVTQKSCESGGPPCLFSFLTACTQLRFFCCMLYIHDKISLLPVLSRRNLYGSAVAGFISCMMSPRIKSCFCHWFLSIFPIDYLCMPGTYVCI